MALGVCTEEVAARLERLFPVERFTDPLVTAVMVTSNKGLRAELARQSAICFLEQNYLNKELLVVMDHNSPDLMIFDPSIRVVRGHEGATLGELRNVGIEESAGEYIIQWDDDDWHREDAIVYQLRELQTCDLAGRPFDGCCLTQQIRYSFADNAGYVKACPVGHAGTIMHRKAVDIRYNSERRSEDATFWKRFWEPPFNCKTLVNDPGIYLRFYHGANTWDRQHIMGSAKPNYFDRAITADNLAYLNSVVQRYHFYGQQ